MGRAFAAYASAGSGHCRTPVNSTLHRRQGRGGRTLRGLSLSRLSALDARPPVLRYQHERPAELIHIATKELGRIDGVCHRITGNGRDGRKGSAYRSHAFRDLLAETRLRHVWIRPYTPRINGKAERFIQTSLR